MERKLDIAKSARTIEWLKSEMMSGISKLFKASFSGNKDDLLEGITDVLITTYVLARRLGFDYEEIDFEMVQQLNLNVKEEHEIEQWYGDLSDLVDHLEEKDSARRGRF